MTTQNLEAVPDEADSPPTSYSIDSLIKGYRAELILPPNRNVSRLSEIYIGANLEEIVGNLTTLREKTDTHFLEMRERAVRDRRLGHDIQLNEQRISRLAPYPIKCCLQITRHMLFLLAQDAEFGDLKGARALTDFGRGGGLVKRIWGALRGEYFQNAIQAGSYYIDVANDTVDPAKEKVEILPLRDSGFRSIDSYQEFADVAETYWNCRIIPNRFFANLAPFIPMIAFFENGAIRLYSQNSYMFPMNLEKNLQLAREFVMNNPCLSGYHPHPLYVVCTHFPE